MTVPSFHQDFVSQPAQVHGLQSPEADFCAVRLMILVGKTQREYVATLFSILLTRYHFMYDALVMRLNNKVSTRHVLSSDKV
jgi:hypothetical protein